MSDESAPRGVERYELRDVLNEGVEIGEILAVWAALAAVPWLLAVFVPGQWADGVAWLLSVLLFATGFLDALLYAVGRAVALADAGAFAGPLGDREP